MQMHLAASTMADEGDWSENYLAHKTLRATSRQQKEGQKAISVNEVPDEKGSNEVRVENGNEGIQE